MTQTAVPELNHCKILSILIALFPFVCNIKLVFRAVVTMLIIYYHCFVLLCLVPSNHPLHYISVFHNWHAAVIWVVSEGSTLAIAFKSIFLECDYVESRLHNMLKETLYNPAEFMFCLLAGLLMLQLVQKLIAGH
jgi:hypothetical protein